MDGHDEDNILLNLATTPSEQNDSVLIKNAKFTRVSFHHITRVRRIIFITHVLSRVVQNLIMYHVLPYKIGLVLTVHNVKTAYLKYVIKILRTQKEWKWRTQIVEIY